jgi:hypothetical protein
MTQRISPKDLQTYRNKVRGSAVPPSTRRSLAGTRGTFKSVAPGAVGNPASSPQHYDSPDEAKRAEYWHYRSLDYSDDVLQVAYHPFAVGLTIGMTYEPDFLIQYRSGDIEIEEYKGSSKQKNYRETLVKLKMAAAKLPMFDWYLCVGNRRRLMR